MVYQYIDNFRVTGSAIALYKPLGLSIPSNHDFHSLLTSFSTRLINKYLVTRVVQCEADPYSGRYWQSNYPAGSYTRCESIVLNYFMSSIQCIIGSDLRSATNSSRNSCVPLCVFAKPFVWHRDDPCNEGFLQTCTTLAAKHHV